MKYTGPAKPIPVCHESMSDRALALWFAVLAVVCVWWIVTRAGCPWCDSMIRRRATVCPKCGRDIPG